MKAQRLDTVWLRLAILVCHILLNLSHYFSDKPTHVEVILVNTNIIPKPSKSPLIKKDPGRLHCVCEHSWYISSKRYVFKEQSRIRLATIYIYPPHISIHMHILILLYDLTLFGSFAWPYNIYIASMLLFYPYLWTPQRLSEEKATIRCALERIHKYHI